MHETLATMMTSRRSKIERVADSRIRSISSLIVDFLLDIRVRGRHVGLGLVVVVVGDEIFDRIVREEPLELLIELGGERLVVRHHQRRPVGARDGLGHREGLARARHAEQHLVLVAALEALRQLGDRPRLIAAELEVGDQFESIVPGGHGWMGCRRHGRLYSLPANVASYHRRGQPSPSLRPSQVTRERPLN